MTPAPQRGGRKRGYKRATLPDRSPSALLPDALTSRRALLALLAALALAGLLFALWPALDLDAAALFYTGDNTFAGQGALGVQLRRVLGDIPFAVLGLMGLAYLARKAGLRRLWSPNGAGLVMMAASLALGPGLLVNVVLKDHSHRPRPYYLKEFGGPAEFRPFYRFDGSCRRNCSFASGEGATAFWAVAPALLAPPPFEPAALAGALALGTATSLHRMAFGGHFLSDVVFAALLTWLVIVLVWRGVARVARQAPGSLPPAPERR